ncbi:RNA-directed DNA polymerase, eukaryota, reverse transcriptase zinc-binding domain protein [Tanacetum coccineum]
MDSGLKMSKLKVDVWNVRGLNQEKRQKEVTQLIKEEKLNVCVIVESYLKANKLVKHVPKILGAGYGSQIVCIAGKDAELLLAGMMLNLGEHTMDGSSLTINMKEFNDCVNKIKVDDLYNSGLFFTWTKNPKAIIPGILNIPEKASKKKKSFRLANYICDKEEFIPIVDQEWKKEVMGCQMYKLVKKLKILKPKLNTLNWKNGNLFDKVVKLRDVVKDKKRLLDKDPHNGNLKNDMVKTLNEYQDAMLLGIIDLMRQKKQVMKQKDQNHH